MAAPQQEALALREGGRRDPAERVGAWRVRQAARTNRTAPRLLDLLAARVRGDGLPVQTAQPEGRTLLVQELQHSLQELAATVSRGHDRLSDLGDRGRLG